MLFKVIKKEIEDTNWGKEKHIHYFIGYIDSTLTNIVFEEDSHKIDKNKYKSLVFKETYYEWCSHDIECYIDDIFCCFNPLLSSYISLFYRLDCNEIHKDEDRYKDTYFFKSLIKSLQDNDTIKISFILSSRGHYKTVWNYVADAIDAYRNKKNNFEYCKSCDEFGRCNIHVKN